MSFLRRVRKLVLGETWSLPAGVAVTLGVAGFLHADAGSWWAHAGGFVLLGLVALALTLSLSGAFRVRRSQAGALRSRADSESASLSLKGSGSQVDK